MLITFPGTFLIPLGIILFFFGRKYLYYLTIFFIPFTATSLINSATGAPLVATQYFGILLFIKELIHIVISGKIPFPSQKINYKPFKYMFVYLIVILSTTIMPLIIDESFPSQPGGATISYQNIHSPFSLILFYKVYSIIFGILLTYIIAIYNSSYKMLYRTVSIYLFSVFFSCLWGGFQFFSNLGTNIYPDFLFNTMVEGNQMILGTTIDTAANSYLRISSVTQEPSHFAQIILTIIPFLLVALVQRTIIFSIVFDRTILITMLITLILSTSSSAILGILVCIVIFSLISYINNIFKIQMLIISILVIFTFIILYFYVPTMQDYFNEIVILKKDSGSAAERIYSVQVAWEYFLKYPILGCGWGMITSHDLIVCLLANSGIIGFLAFFAMVISIFSDSMKSVNRIYRIDDINKKYLFTISNSFIISIATYLTTCAFVEFTWYLFHFYFLLGILVAVNINISNLSITKYNGH